MTDRPILKEQIRKVIFDHLNSLGYPNMTNQEIMQELEPMWIKLTQAGLIKDGLNFMGYLQHANEQLIITELLRGY